MASLLWFRKVVGKIFLFRLLFDVILQSNDLVSLMTGSISFQRICKKDCQLLVESLCWLLILKIFVFFKKKDNRFLRFANLISVNLLLSILLDMSRPLYNQLNFALYSCFTFLKWSLFSVQPVFLKFL